MTERGTRPFTPEKALALLFLLLVFSGVPVCAVAQAPEALFTLPVQRSVRRVSDKLTVRIYFDATSSMSGFTAVRSNAGFVGFVQKLEQAFAIGWKSSAIECYKFGLKISRLPGNRCYLLPTERGFYDLSTKDDVTRIDLVLDGIDGSALTVILTDLYQDDADLGAIFQSAKRTVFARNLSIGIVGIMSPYSGTVYDIGLNKDVREWKKERPFYALVVGQKGDVIRCFEELSSAPISVPRERMLILSTDLLEQPLNWDTAARLEPDRVAEDDRLIPGGRRTAWSKGIRLQSTDAPCNLRIRVVPEFSPFHPTFDPARAGALFTKLDLRLLRNGKGTPVPPDGATAKFSGAFQPKDSRQDGRAAVDVTWQPRRFLRNGDYLLEVRVGFDPAGIRFPPFVSSWSVPVGDALAGDRFDGSKTQNLKELILGLWRIMLEQYGDWLGAYYLYFHK